MTDPINVGLAVVLILLALVAAFVWIEPTAASWVAGKLMARRAYIIEGRKAKYLAWQAWKAEHE